MAFSEKTSSNSSKLHEDIAKFKDQYLKSMNLPSVEDKPSLLCSELLKSSATRRQRSSSSAAVLAHQDGVFFCTSTSSRRESCPITTSSPQCYSSRSSSTSGSDIDPQKKTLSPPIRLTSFEDEIPSLDSAIGDSVSSPTEANDPEFPLIKPVSSPQDVFAHWKLRAGSGKVSSQNLPFPADVAREKLKDDYIKSLGLRERSSPLESLPKLNYRKTQLQNRMVLDSLHGQPKRQLQKEQFEVTDSASLRTPLTGDTANEPKDRHKLTLEIPNTVTFQLGTSPDSAVAELYSPSNASPLAFISPLISKNLKGTSEKKNCLSLEATDSTSNDNSHVPGQFKNTNLSHSRKIPPPVSPKPPWLRAKALRNKTVTLNPSNSEESSIHNEDSSLYIDSTLDIEKNAFHTQASSVDQIKSVSPPSETTDFKFNVKSIAARFSKSIEERATAQSGRKAGVVTLPYSQKNNSETEPRRNSCVKSIVRTFETDKEQSTFTSRAGSQASLTSQSEDSDSLFGDNISINTGKTDATGKNVSGKKLDGITCNTHNISEDSSLCKLREKNLLADQHAVLENAMHKERSLSEESNSDLPSRQSTQLLKQKLTEHALQTNKVESKDTIAPSKLPDSVIKKFDYTENTEGDSKKGQARQRVTRKELHKNCESAVQLGAQRFQNLIEAHDSKQETFRHAREKQPRIQSDTRSVVIAEETTKSSDGSLDELHGSLPNLECMDFYSSNTNRYNEVHLTEATDLEKTAEESSDLTESQKTSVKTHGVATTYPRNTEDSISTPSHAEHTVEQTITRLKDTDVPDVTALSDSETLGRSAFTSKAYSPSHLGNPMSEAVSKTHRLHIENTGLGEKTNTLDEAVLSDKVSPLSGSEVRGIVSEQVAVSSRKLQEKGDGAEYESLPKNSTLVEKRSEISTVDIKTVPPKAFYYLCDPNSESAGMFSSEESQFAGGSQYQDPSSPITWDPEIMLSCVKDDSITGHSTIYISDNQSNTDTNRDIVTVAGIKNSGSNTTNRTLCTISSELDQSSSDNDTDIVSLSNSISTGKYTQHSGDDNLLELDVTYNKVTDESAFSNSIDIILSKNEIADSPIPCSRKSLSHSAIFQTDEPSVIDDNIDANSTMTHTLHPREDESGLTSALNDGNNPVSLVTVHEDKETDNTSVSKSINVQDKESLALEMYDRNGSSCSAVDIRKPKDNIPSLEFKSTDTETSPNDLPLLVSDNENDFNSPYSISEKGNFAAKLHCDSAFLDTGGSDTLKIFKSELNDKSTRDNSLHSCCDDNEVSTTGNSSREFVGYGNPATDKIPGAYFVEDDSNISMLSIQSTNNVGPDSERKIPQSVSEGNDTFATMKFGNEVLGDDSSSCADETDTYSQNPHGSNFQYPSTTDPEDGLQETRPYHVRDYNDQTISHRRLEGFEAFLENTSFIQSPEYLQTHDKVSFKGGNEESTNISFPDNVGLMFLDSPIEDSNETQFPFVISDSYSEASSSFNSLLSGITRRSSDSSFHSAADFAEITAEVGEYKQAQSSSCDMSESESLYGSAVFTPSLSQATSAGISTTELWSKLWELDGAKASDSVDASRDHTKETGADLVDHNHHICFTNNDCFSFAPNGSHRHNRYEDEEECDEHAISDRSYPLRHVLSDKDVEVDSLDGDDINDDEFFEECMGDLATQTPELVRSLSWDELKSAQFISQENSKPTHFEDAFSETSKLDSAWGSPRLARFVTLDSLQVEDLQEPDHSIFDTFKHAETIEELDEEIEEEEEMEEESSPSLRRKSGLQVPEFSRLSIIMEEEAEAEEMWSSAISDFDTSRDKERTTSKLHYSHEETTGALGNPDPSGSTRATSLPSMPNTSSTWQEGVSTAIKSGVFWMLESTCGYSTESLEGSSGTTDDDDNVDKDNDHDDEDIEASNADEENRDDGKRYSSASSSASSSPYGSMEIDSLDGTYENLAALSERLLWEEQNLNSAATVERTEGTGADGRSATGRPPVTTAGPGVGQATSATSSQHSEQTSLPRPVPLASSDAAANTVHQSIASTLSQNQCPTEQLPINAVTDPNLSQDHSQQYPSESRSNEDSLQSLPEKENANLPQCGIFPSTTLSHSCTPANTTSQLVSELTQNEVAIGTTFSEESCTSIFLPSEFFVSPDKQTDREESSTSQRQEFGHVQIPSQAHISFTEAPIKAEGEAASITISLEQSDLYDNPNTAETPSNLSYSHPLSQGIKTLTGEVVCSAQTARTGEVKVVNSLTSGQDVQNTTEENSVCLKTIPIEENPADTSCIGMDEDDKSSSTKSDTKLQSQNPAKPPVVKSISSSSSGSTYSSTTATASSSSSTSSSSSYSSTLHSSSQVSIKSGTTMMSSEDPGPVRRKSLDLGKSSTSKTEGRRRHNTDMDEMVEELMRGVEDGGDPLLDESASSSISSAPSSSSESSPSQTSIQRIASASSLRKSTASDPYKALERSQSDASLMRDLVLLDTEEVHLTAAESSSGQNISECNRVYLDLSRAEAFEKVEHNDVACSIMRTSSGRHLETIPQDEELKTEDLSYIYNTSRSFSQESSSEDLTSSKSKMKDSNSRTKGGSGQSSQDGGNSIGPKSNLRSSFQIYSHSLKQKLRQLQMGSVPEQVNALTELNVLMEQAWSMPVYGKDLAYELCDIIRTESALDIIVSNLASPNRELMKVSSRLLEQSLTTSNRRQVAHNGLERVVKMTCECRGDCELAQTTTGILESLFKTSEDTCASVIKLGGLEVITYWCRCNDRVTLKNCAIALSNLALYGGSENQQEMTKYKVPEWLFPLAFVEDDSVRYYALLAIGVLVSNKEIESAVMSSGTLALVLPFIDTHDPAEFAQGDMSHRHGRSPGWLKRLIPVLSSRREEAQALAAFHFVMEAGIKSEQGRIEVLYDIGAVEPLKWLASTPNRVASKLAGQALKIIGEEIPHKLSQQVPLWTPSDVAHWTAQVGFGAYTENFEKCQVDGDLLLRLTDQDLKDSIDMTCSITRKRFLRELRDLKISCDYTSCDPSMLGAWLRGDVGEEMAQYTYQMLNTGVDRPLLPSITDDHLTSDCFIKNGIHRMKILARIEELRTMARSQSSVLYDSPDGPGPASISGYRAPIDCFISYRRSNGSQLASLLKVHLQLRGFTVFIDIERLRAGKFDESLLESVRQARNFIIVLTPNSLDRCMGDEERKDWVHKEITAAIESGINIIPLIDNFRWPSPETLPEDMRNVCYFNHVRWIHDYQDACVDKLERFIRGETNPLKFCSPAIGPGSGSGSGSVSSPHGTGVAVRNESVSSPISTVPPPPTTSLSTSNASSSSSSTSAAASSSNTRVVSSSSAASSSSSSKATPNTCVTTTTTAFAGPNSPPYRRAQSLAAAHSVDIDDSPTTPS